ncbi:MAG TPA: hypothetical protein VLF20_01955, partial [Patescibacteria group bacterium]|nr:hypothetical protein [Patescibacteria group bacterium]
TLGGIYFFDRWIEASSKFKVKNVKLPLKIQLYGFYLFAMIFTAAAFLLKPYALFFILPMVYLAWKAWRWKLFLQWQLWIFAALTVTPLMWWRTWMTQFPEGIPANAWLLNGNGIRFRPAFFRWVFYERLTVLISGYALAFLAVIGVVRLPKIKDWLFFASFFVGSLLYVCVFATGNVQHDYYQIPIIPSVAIALAIGSYFLSRFFVRKIPLGIILVVVCIVMGFYFSWERVKDYFNINNRAILVAGEAVDRLTPKDAKVIANYTGDSSFLYQTKRKGWASFQDSLPVMVEKGAEYLVLVNPVEQDYAIAEEGYTIIAETKEYLIFDLKNN